MDNYCYLLDAQIYKSCNIFQYMQKNKISIIIFLSQERQKNTQFIIVSLRNIMNELADHLIGIYKTGNTSKNVSLMGAAKWKDEDEALDKSLDRSLDRSQSKKRKSK